MEAGDARTGGPTRRHLLAGTGAGAVAVAVAACGSGSDTAAPSPEGSPASDGSGSAGGGASGGGTGLTAVADVPVGGAVSATDANGKPVIVSQPSKGDIVAFSAICTHKGCTVAPQGDQLVCPCHGSTYDLATGDNTGGPAPSPLPEITVSVKDGQVVES
jgi:cytochrome b6-f complex iron-sulfur subunit